MTAKKIETAAIAAAIAANPALVKKVEKPAKAKAVAAKPAATPPSEEKVRKAWNHGQSVVHHAVRVGKASFTSTWMAFLAIPELKAMGDKARGRCIKFRKELKQKGSLDFVVPETKKAFKFEIIAE